MMIISAVERCSGKDFASGLHDSARGLSESLPSKQVYACFISHI